MGLRFRKSVVRSITMIWPSSAARIPGLFMITLRIENCDRLSPTGASLAS